MEPHSGPFRWFKIFTICLLSLFLFSPIFQIPSQAAPEPSPEQAVQAVQHAWELAQEIGIYHFTTDVEQTTYPAPAIANVGRSSSIQTYYLEGDVDSPAQAFYMTLWQGGGNAATQKDGIEIRMEGGEAYGRPIGGLWQEIDDFSGLFAPGSDPMAYLAGAKNITLVSSHTQYALRYMFDLDGPAFAAHMRDLLEDQLRRSGELPPGLSLDSSILYREMTGLGEIWLDAQGLPLRLLVDLEMPDPKTGERVSARIKTDFSNFAQQPETAIGFIAEIPTWDWGLILPQVAFWGLFCSGIIVFVLFRHSQKVYAALVIALIFSMVGTPLLQSAQVAAFYETQEQKQLEFESAQNERAANQEARDELLTSSWDPHQNPVFSDQSSVFSLQSPVFSPQSPITNLQSLAQHPRQGAISNLQSPSLDTDLDGIADAVEQALGTEINDPDTDGDTLNDGVEFLRLGTDPLSKDSDGDGIFDNVEVTGFMDVNGLHWYLDPNSPDTNKDSRIDTEECHQLVGRNTVGDRKCSDTDGDSTPDIFDRDDDGDDVADPVDIYPMGMVDRDGQHTNGSNPNAFTDDHPFELKIESLQTGLPVFVDFQLRPENPDHLTYALNVLDWPSEDIEGQIQHVKHTTFASDFTDEQLTGNPSAANGDMRLIPMLELTISGDHVPFARTNPAIDVAVRGVISGTIQLEQASSNRDNTSLDFSFDDPGQDYTVKIYEGGCPVSGTPVKTYTNRSDGDSSTWTGKKVVDLANGTYALTVSNGTDTVCAAIGNIINGPYIYAMIDPEPLRPYGISVREADQNGTLIAYIPLNMVPDETGGGRVAFSARMAYELGTDATWDQAQQVRMVWMLEMLTDSCDSNGFEEDWAAMTLSDPTLGMKAGSKDAAFRTWCSLPEHRTPDTSRIVHTYDDSWILTGLAVREDHGLDVAVVYEDPAQGDVATSENLWQLSRGLAATFLVGRDCEDNDVTTYPDYDPDTGSCNDDTYRDISVYTNGPDGNTIGNTNIYNRFDASGSAADGDDQRWGIPKAALQVARFRYDSQDYATYLAMTETPDILEANFAHTDEPTLLFAREEHYRSADLGAASKSGSVFTVNMVSSNQPLQTVTGLKWMPYAYDDDTGWSPIPIRELWDDLIIQYEDTFAQTYPEDTEAANLGRAVVARSYYVSLIQGLVQQVEIGSDLLWQPDLEGEADDWVYSVETQLEYISFFGWILADVLKEAFDTYGTKWRFINISGFSVDSGVLKPWQSLLPVEEFHGALESIGEGIKSATWGPWASLFSGGVKSKIGAGIALAGAVAVVGLTIYGITQQSNALDIVSMVMTGLWVILAIQNLVSTAVQVIKAVQEAGSMAAAVSKGLSEATSNIKSTFKSAAVVGLIISVVATWAALGAQIGLSYGLGGGMSSIALGTAIAGAIAATVVMVIMFVIAAIPIVGQIIAAIIMLIDAVVSLFCTIFLDEEQAEHPAAEWFCGGLQGIVTKALTVLIYSGNVMVELYPEDYDRLEFYDFLADDLVDPDLGISVGNKVKYSLSITNTIDIAPLPDDLGAAYRYQYNDKQLRSSAFSYDLSITNTVELHENLDRYTTTDWEYVDGGSEADWGDFGHTWHKAEPVYINRTVQHPDGVPFEVAGINQSVPLYLLEGWAVPSQNCILGICTIWTDRGTENFNLGSGLKFDVFPVTLDEFYTLTSKDGGYALAWSQSGDVTFPRLVDGDGDGIPYPVDAHDNVWDNDGDGLSDSFEVKLGSNPDNKDSDGDGLPDNLELISETNPLRTDSDGDGLSDGAEVYHQDITDHDSDGNFTEWLGGWEYGYNLKPDGTLQTTWVSSSPMSTDSDGDSLTDFQEKTFGFNPTWMSNPTILTFESTISESDGSGGYTDSDGFALPGDTLYYAASVENELYNRWAHGLLDTDFPGVLDDDAIDPQPFLLYPLEQQVIEGQVPVANTAASGVYNLTQTAGALISDWAELASGAALWYPFEDDAAATTYADRSGSIPPDDGTCSNATPGAGCVPIKNDGVYGGSLNFDGTARVASDYDPADNAFAISLWFKTTEPNGGLLDTQGFWDRWLYLYGGNVKARMYNGVSHQILTSAQTYNDGDWHHVVHTFGGSAGGQKLYVDGQRVDSGSYTTARASTNGIRLGYANISGIGYFDGKIDDVRLFERGLTFTEVQAIFDTPILDLRFNESSGWQDSSPFANDASCTGTCPDHVDGIDGRGANFSGSHYITVPSDDSLKLNQGGFTIGVWIYPTESPEYCYQREFYSPPCDIWKPQPQGILGFGSGEDNAYPTLQRVGNALRFTYGDKPYFTTGDVLQPNKWNHVAVSYDGSAVLIYVNGVKVAEDSTTFTTPPPGTKTLTVGRSGTAGTFEVKKVRVDEEGDGIGKAEMCIAFRSYGGDWQTVFDQQVDGGLVDASYFPLLYNVAAGPFEFNTLADLRVWEDDGGEHCVTVNNKSDSDPIDDGDDGMGFWSFRTTDVSKGFDKLYSTDPTTDPYRHYGLMGYSGDSSGHFYMVYHNDSIPFYGKIDELLIYNRPFDADSVLDMYQAQRLSLHLKFDDPPGETSFVDSSFGHHNASCGGAACPVAGVAGRVNQAAIFDGNDHLTLANSGINRLTNEFSVAAWIRPESVSGYHRILSTARTNSHNGFAFGTYNDGLSFTTFGKKDYALTGLGLVTGKWTHVAAVMDENNAVSFYVNGVFQDIVAGSSPASADTDDALLVGATTDSGSSVRIQTFNGRIDDLYVFSNALSEAGILNLYQNAPAFQLHLDETQSATGFSDDANPSRMVSCTGSHCPQVGFGVDGQLGTAAQFDGVDDYIYTPYSQQTTGDFSISAWVRPTAIRDGQQPIFVHYATSYANFGLFIKPDSMIPQFLAHGCAGGSETVLDSGSALIMNSWNHIVGTYSGGTMTIYINGAPQGSQNWNRCQNPGPFWVGGNVPDTVPFAGQLDEVTLYNHALSRQMIAEIFNYQGKWVQERQSHNIAIDDDNPTVTLETTGDRLPDTDVQMLVIASDPTSGIQSVQFGVQAPGQSSYTWSDAPPCQDAAAETAWCPTFNPAGEGAYSLRAKVTDLVGHISTTDATVYVDNQSPTATFDFTANALLLPTLSDTQPNTWELALSGMISDPDIGSEAGSGVAASSLQVSVFNENGTLVGPAPQPPTLNGDNWSLDYDIAEPYPSGIFTVTLTATDKIVLRAGLDDSQLDRHSLETSRLIQIDATPAAGYLDLGGVTALITDTQTLEGQATERPVHLRVAWNTDAHADQLGLAITCNGLIQHQFQPGTLQPLADSYSWSGDVHRGAACQIHLTDTGGDGGTSGTIEACGEEIADWDASFGGGQVVNFTAVADACGPSLDVAGVAGVETALVSVLPGSPFYNQEPIPGATLHLPFDDVPTANGTLSFRDISGENRNGTCTGIACPTWGQPGHVGRAVSFSGAQWIDSTNFDIDDDFTLSLWINPLATSDGQSFIGKHTYGGSNLIVFGFWNGGYSFRIRSDSYDAGTKTTGWQHLVVVGQKTSATTTLVTVYKDNQLLWQHTLNAVVGNVSGKPWSFGQEWDGNTRSDYFSGLMDEARFFDRAMDAAEISELNMGANPVLHLPLDESWASNGTALPDQSGWAHDGWLSAGIGDMVNKAAPGGVGPYALDFDGSDDHITIPDSNALDLEQFSVGLWVRPDTWSYSVDNPLILKGNQSGNNLNYGIYITAQGKLSFRFYDASCTTLHAVEDGVAPLHQWSHILATYDGTQVSIYRNGQVVKTEAVSGGVCQNNDPVWIGETPGGVTTYEGLIDDVILYPRVISEPEVESLYAAGWQSTTTTPTGVGVELSDWNTSIPAGLEGTFRLDLRGEDMNALVSKPEAAWQGEIDTLDPRVTLDAQVSGDTVQYTTIAADWNLTESGYNTPCGAGIIDQREYFESPWYQALGTGEQRVYQLTTQCEHSIAELSGEVGAYDTPGLSYGVAVSSTLSYIADGEGGLQIVDVSNPVQPQFVGSLGGIYPWAVAVAPGGAVLIPDLMVDSIAVEPASPEINQAFIVSVTVRNQGAGTAWNFTTAIYQDAQPAACEGSIPQWTAAIPRLDAGQSAVVAFSHSGFSSFTPHTLYAQADSGCMVAESDEANNIAGPLYITAVQSDLVVESLSFDPVSPFENQPFTITAVISNTGTGAAATFSTTIYIDQAIGFTDCNVPGWATMSVSSLAAGTSTEVVFNHSGLSATGDYEVIAYADSGCDVAESQELNNLAGDWVTVVTAPKPDLLITLITSETNSPIINQPFVVTTTVHNQGTAASGAFTTTVFLDEQPLACPNLTGQFDATRITNLDPGESATITFTHPGISTYGGHFITSQADSHCEVIESIETNNTSTRLNLNVVDPNKPDLTIENIVTHPITPTINQSFIISVTLKNQGLGIAVDFYGYIMTAIYQDKVPSNCDEGTLWIYTGPLNPGETRIITRTLAGISTPGPHQFYANVDSACEISESNEDNNIFGPITVTARAPDLIVEEIATQPITPTINQSLVVSVTIKNQGLEAAQNFDTTFYFDHIPSQCDEGAPDWYFAHTDYLTAGVSTVVTMTYPGFNSTGTHQIYAQADGACQVTEADEDNNIYGPHDVTVSSSGPAPDLIIEALDTQPAAPGVNQPFSITVLVKNQGLLGTGSFDTGVFINEQPTGGCHDIPWDYQMISLAAGISTTLTFEHPGLIEGGPNDIYAMADVWCTEIESNESNNIFGPITIDVAALDGNRRQSYAGDFAWPGKPLLAVFSRLVFRPGSGQPVAGQVEPSMQASTPTLTSVYTYTYAYIADVSYGLRIVDVSDPASPAQVGALPLPGPMRNIVVAGDYAYLVSQFNGLFVVDISNPGYPGLLDSYATPGHTEGLDVSGGYAYVADRLAGLQVIDVSDPNALQWKAVYNTPGYAYGVDMVGGYAYVADGSGGLQVLDISNPSSPQFVGELDSIYAVDIDVNGNTAYIVTGSQGLAVVDISDPANPELERWFNTPGYAQDVVFSGELAYIADQDSGLRVINPTEHIPEATACDTAGHCTTVEMTHSAADLVQVALDRNPQAEIHFPLAAPPLSVEILNLPSVLDSTAPFTITGHATSTLTTLELITVTVDGTALMVTGWVSGTQESDWNAGWTPAGDGPHLVRADVLGAYGSTASETVTVTVDTLAPTVNISPTVYTSADYYEPRTINLRGEYADAGGVASVEWRVADGEWRVASGEWRVAGGEWRGGWSLDAGPLPDNETFTVYARATDIAGHTTEISETVTVDVLPPEAVTLTLTGNGSPLAPGEILPTAAANFVLTWDASSDGSGLDDYQVRWTTQVTDTISAEFTHTVPTTGPLTSVYAAVDGQKVSVELGSRDTLGNQRWQSFGSVFVDSQLALDYIAMNVGDEGMYRGWMESDCTDLGIDRRANRIYGNIPAQELFASWNAGALRLAWIGGNWYADGDLFLYLDTAAGGTNQVYDPFGATYDITLPDGMLADYLVWVQDGETASLLHWEGGWVVASDQLPVSSFQFSVFSGQWSAVTDLYLPLDMIGLHAGDSFSLLGIATENDSLNIWATLPNANPVNSKKALGRLFTLDEENDFQLSHAYHWDALSAGICPNGSITPAAGAYLDTEVQVNLSADPAGASFNLMGDGLFWLQNLLLGSPPADVTTQLDFLAGDQTPLHHEQTVTYTLSYRNRGSDIAYGVFANVEALFAMTLPGGNSVPIGDIPPGADGEVTFTGVVDTNISAEPWAGVAIEIFDAAHPDSGNPIEWLWTHHRVDNTGPEFFGAQQPAYLLGPGMNTLRGYAYDPAGVKDLTVQVQGSGQTFDCPDSTPMDGTWSCDWEVSGQNNDLFTLQLQATDGFGLTSGWSPGQTFLLDKQAPIVTLDISVTSVFSGSLVHGSRFTLYGDVEDNGGLGRVDVCVDGDCQQADLRLQPGQGAVTVADTPGTPVAINNGTPCNGSEILVTFGVAESFAVGNVQLGFVAEHERRDDLRVTLISPLGTAVQLLTDDGISGTDFRHADFWFADAAPLDFSQALGDHDPGAPDYEHFARPDQPLSAFWGQAAQGDWTLEICDLNPNTDDGAYLSSQLTLIPQETHSKSGRWSQQVQISDTDGLDYVTKEIRVYGQDLVGNRTGNPLALDLIIDSVAPVITVTAEITQGTLGDTVVVLGGVVTDGGPATNLSVHVYPPEGTPYSVRAARNGDGWEFELDFTLVGTYTLWVNASDLAGNAATTGPFEVVVRPPTQVFLPLVLSNSAAGQGVHGPDLVVEHILVTQNNVQIIIANHGNAPVADAFWVDLYIDPDPIPTAVNQTWDMLCYEGLAWGVTDVSSLIPGGTLTIDMNHPSFRPDYSLLYDDFDPAMAIYVQVDSYASTTYGGVLESHEVEGTAYNNISGPTFPLPISLDQDILQFMQSSPTQDEINLLPER